MKKWSLIGLVFMLAVLLAMPVMAAKAEKSATIYGSVRMATWWGVYDAPSNSTVDDDEDLIWDLQGNSRLGAKVKIGSLSGRYELGLPGAGGSNNTYTRLIYGAWNFGGGSLLIGQTYTPAAWFSNQAAMGDWGFIGYGFMYDGRQPQIKLSTGGFYVALVRPSTAGMPEGTAIDTTLPKIYIGYDMKAGNFFLGPGFMYNTFNAELNNFDDDIASWAIYLKGKANFGAVNLKFSGYYGVNLGNAGIAGPSDSAVLVPTATATATTFAVNPATGAIEASTETTALDYSVEDTTTWGGYLQVGFKAGTIGITLGYGYAVSDNDTYGDPDAHQSYFIQANIPFTKGFFIVPEFSYFDEMDDTNGCEEADMWFLGAKWQLNF